ncbi:hypothetical protein D3C71_153560 [compost metagenome]
MSSNSPYLVEINDWAPDVIEYRPADDQDWTKIDFPPEAYFFAFFERAKRASEQIPSTWYYLSTDPRLFTAEEAKAQFPDYADDIALWADKGVTVFVNHAYDCKGYKGDRVIPMTRETVFIDRKAMQQIWPPQP